LYINEIQSSNDSLIFDNNNEDDDWIEIYNSSNSSIDLLNYYISDDITDPLKWQINSSISIPATDHILLWADEEVLQGADHLNFKLSSNGESIVLTKPDGLTVQDNVTFPPLSKNESYARTTDAGSIWAIFDQSSPNNLNVNGILKIEQPVFSIDDGLYNSSQTVSITSTTASTDIYYTLDGSEPDNSDILYTGPIVVSTTSIIRSIASLPGIGSSKISTATYAINESNNIPMVFLTAEPDYFWEDSIGIYATGVNGVVGGCGVPGLKNYYQPDWERDAHVAYIESSGQLGFKKNVEMEISGGCTRHLAKKSINLKFKKNSGENEIFYPLFETQDSMVYSGFKLRNFGNWTWGRRIDDALLHRVMENKIDLDLQSSRLVSVYINGAYWGVYYIRDRANVNYLKTHHSKVDRDDIDMLKNPLSSYASAPKAGDSIAYGALAQYMMNNDLNIQTHYDYVSAQVDVDELMNYTLSHIYYNARDWAGNNCMAWRPRSNGGKWRWISYDLDSYLANPVGNHIFDNFWVNTTPTSWKHSEPICAPYIRMIENDAYKYEFSQKMYTLIHTIWDPTNVLPIYNDMMNEMDQEIQADIARWNGDYTYGAWLDNVRYTYTDWQNNVPNVYNFFVDRPAYVLPKISSVFLGDPGVFDLTLNCTASSNGKVALHSERLVMPYSYVGEYFQSTPIRIKAIADAGYKFSHWQETGSTDEELYISFTANTTLTPIFVPALDLVINEIHYNPIGSLESHEFIELYNPDTDVKNLEGYTFSDGLCFEFPKGTQILPDEYIIIAKDGANYLGNGYQVFQFTASSISNSGEKIVLENALGQTIDMVSYLDNSPWPLDADGIGYSLALKDSQIDNSHSASWAIQTPNTPVTPGSENLFCIDATITKTITHPECQGINDGAVTLNVAGALGPYTYAWSHGPISSSISGLSPGTYICTITDIHGCITIDTTVVQAPVAVSAINLNLVTISSSYLIANWSPIPNNVNYYVQFREVGMATWSTYNTIGTAAIISNLNSCTDYEIRIGGDCSADGISNFNPLQTFTTDGCFICTAPIGLYQFNIQNISAIITWDVLVGATDYTYKFRKVGDTNWISQTTTFPIAVLFGISACTDYEWTIETTCYDGSTAQSPTINNFTTLCKNDVVKENVVDISVYPNPTSSYINLEVSDEFIGSKGIIRDSYGRLQMSFDIQSNHEIVKIRPLSSGIYILSLKNETLRLVIE